MLYVHAIPALAPPSILPSIQNPFRVPPQTTTKREFISAEEGEDGSFKSISKHRSQSLNFMRPVVPGIQQVFTCFAVVHALFWICTYLTLSLGWIRQISMATEATASRWRALEDALGPSCDEGMHLSCKLNCASAEFIKLAWNQYLNMSRRRTDRDMQTLKCEILCKWDVFLFYNCNNNIQKKDIACFFCFYFHLKFRKRKKERITFRLQ